MKYISKIIDRNFRLEIPCNVVRLFALTIACKTTLLLITGSLIACTRPELQLSNLAFDFGDTFSYMEPIKNFKDNGQYYLERFGEKYYSVRPPYYGILFYIFSTILQDKEAYNLLIGTAIVLDSVATITLSIVASEKTGHRFFVFMIWLTLTLSSTASHLSVYIIPVGISTSLLSIGLFFLHKSCRRRGNLTPLLTGLCFAIGIGLRPYTLILIPLATWTLWTTTSACMPDKRKNLYAKATRLIFFSIPFFLIIGPWVARNYNIYNIVAPYEYRISEAYGFDTLAFEKRSFLNAIGHSDIHWDYSSAASFFENDHSPSKLKSRYQFPQWLTENIVSLSELEHARSLYLEARPSNDDIQKNHAAQYFLELTKRIKTSTPIRFHFLSPLQNASRLLIHSGSYYLPVVRGSPCERRWQWVWKIVESSIYWMTMLIFPIASTIGIKTGDKIILTAAAAPISVLFIAGFWFHSSEARYMHYAFPEMVLTVTLGISLIYSRVRQFKKHGG